MQQFYWEKMGNIYTMDPNGMHVAPCTDLHSNTYTIIYLYTIPGAWHGKQWKSMEISWHPWEWSASSVNPLYNHLTGQLGGLNKPAFSAAFLEAALVWIDHFLRASFLSWNLWLASGFIVVCFRAGELPLQQPLMYPIKDGRWKRIISRHN